MISSSPFNGKQRLDFEWDRLNKRTKMETMRINPNYHYNPIKNRYSNVLPVEDTRVKLLCKRLIEDEINNEFNDYINANYIQFNHSKFIATMAPTPMTFNDFWQMVWEQDVVLIIMIMKLVEDGKIKGDKYWPDSENDFVTKDFKVKLVNQQYHTSNNYIYIRNLELTHLHTEKSKLLKHINFLGWPDFGVPSDTASIRELVKLMKESDSNMTLVHCSAGIGRTGTFISIAIGLELLNNSINEGYDINIDVENLVLSLRKQRNKGMVQNLQQYQYIYSVINEEKKEICNQNLHDIQNEEKKDNSNE
jgi:protein-tyrosine phosphatase